MKWILYFFMGVGFLLSGINFYISFLAHYFEKGKVGSGIPMFGSLFLFIGLFFIENRTMVTLSIVFILLDTGGIHWGVATVLYYETIGKLIVCRNQADALSSQTEKALEENGDKIDAGEKAAIESALAELKAVVKNTDATKEALEAATKKLSDASHKMAEQMYKNEGGEGAASSAKKEDDVIDAEIE